MYCHFQRQSRESSKPLAGSKLRFQTVVVLGCGESSFSRRHRLYCSAVRSVYEEGDATFKKGMTASFLIAAPWIWGSRKRGGVTTMAPPRLGRKERWLLS